MITSFQFARLVAAQLRNADIKAVVPDFTLPEPFPYYRVRGILDAGATLAAIEVRVWWEFERLKIYPPTALCHEPWMKNDIDWHNSRVYGMCWILANLWRDLMSWKGKSALSIVQEGSILLINDVRCLIARHFVGHLEKLDKWPQEWTDWPHLDAKKQYEREKQQQRNEAAEAS